MRERGGVMRGGGYMCGVGGWVGGREKGWEREWMAGRVREVFERCNSGAYAGVL